MAWCKCQCPLSILPRRVTLTHSPEPSILRPLQAERKVSVIDCVYPGYYKYLQFEGLPVDRISLQVALQ